MKKIVFISLGIMSTIGLTSCATTEATNAEQNPISMIWIVAYALVLLAMYFLFIRPNSKKKKEEEALRESLEIGDELITIGGITGRVVNIKEDGSFILETGPDRTKILFQKWALSSIITEKNVSDPKADKKAKKEKKKVDEK